MAEREVGGVVYTCNKLPAEPGLELFLRVSTVLSGATGLLEAIAADSDNPELVRRFGDFVKVMDPVAVASLVKELAGLCKGPPGTDAHPHEMRELLELAFLALGTNYSDFLPVSLDRGLMKDEAEDLVAV